MNLSSVVKVFKTFQHLPQNSCYGHFIKNTSRAICCPHAMFDDVQQWT